MSKAYHHERVLWSGGVISRRAVFCHEFGVNPDVDELERYNIAARSRECDHAKLRFIDTGEREFYACEGCGLSDPDWRNKFTLCLCASSYHRDPNCAHCGGTGLLPRAADGP